MTPIKKKKRKHQKSTSIQTRTIDNQHVPQSQPTVLLYELFPHTHIIAKDSQCKIRRDIDKMQEPGHAAGQTKCQRQDQRCKVNAKPPR